MAQMTELFVQCRRLVLAAAFIVAGVGSDQHRVGPAGRRHRQRRSDHRARHRAARETDADLPTQKAPPRQEVLDELINEKLKIQEAKRFGLEVTDTEVDQSFATMASRMRLTPEQLTQALAQDRRPRRAR